MIFQDIAADDVPEYKYKSVEVIINYLSTHDISVLIFLLIYLPDQF